MFLRAQYKQADLDTCLAFSSLEDSYARCKKLTVLVRPNNGIDGSNPVRGVDLCFVFSSKSRGLEICRCTSEVLYRSNSES